MPTCPPSGTVLTHSTPLPHSTVRMISVWATSQRPTSYWPLIRRNGRCRIFFLSLARVLICIQKQDHYAVLGLSHLRYTATLAQIKIARASDPSQGRPYIITYLLSPDRKKVLKHHPDKKAGSTSTSVQSLLTGINTNDDAFFKCIQKAHEVLTNPEKRRQFDSVDPAFLEVEDDVPTAASFKVCFVV